MAVTVQQRLRQRWQQAKAFRLSLVALVVFVVLAVGLAHQTVSSGRLDRFGWSLDTAGSGSLSEHRDLVSVVLVIGNQDHGILEVTEAVLHMTVGPYELIAVFAGGPNDVSQSVVDLQVSKHKVAKVDTLGRGMRSYSSLNVTGTDPIEASAIGMRRASNEFVILLNGQDMVREYGWDRILLMGLKSSPDFLAVSGRAAGDISLLEDGGVQLVNVVGGLSRGGHDSEASPEFVDMRDVALRSPIIYSRSKIGKLGLFGEPLEAEGLGDADLCLRGRKLYRWSCGYYPIAVRTLDEWKLAPGTPRLGDGTISSHQAALLRVTDYWESMRGGGPPNADSSVQAIPRHVEDIPKTIVTAFSGNHQLSVQHLYSTLHLSPHTRLVAYILRSSIAVSLESFSSWQNVEIREFDFDRRPAFMDLDVNKGEYAWKPQIIEEVVRDFGGLVLWMDSGDRISERLGMAFWEDVARSGIWSTNSGGEIWQWTHPGMFAFLDVPQHLWKSQNCNAANIGLNSQNARAMVKVSRPWFACSFDKNCIAPPGSSRANHRQDQAALSCFVYLAGYHCEHHGPIDTQQDDPNEEQ